MGLLTDFKCSNGVKSEDVTLFWKLKRWIYPIFASMIKTTLRLAFVCFAMLLVSFSYGQEVQIELGPDEIGLNETFTIKVTLANDKIKFSRGAAAGSAADSRHTPSQPAQA